MPSAVDAPLAAATPPWSLADILWDPETCTAVAAPVRAPADAPLLPPPLPPALGGAKEPAWACGAAPLAAPPAAPAPPRPAAEREVRCQVAGCEAPLREAGRYNVRNRLCPTHLRAPELHLANGAVARFCQKCNRCHELSEFAGTQRSCRKQLALSVTRRRARQEAARASAGGSGAEASGGSLSATSGDSAPPAQAGPAAAPAASAGSGGGRRSPDGSASGGGAAAALCAATPLPPLGSLFDDLFADYLAEPDAAAGAAAPPHASEFWDAFGPLPGPPFPAPPAASWPPQQAPPGMSLADALAALPWLAPARVELKLGGELATPANLPPAFASAAAATLFAATPMAFTAAAAPGCTLLTMEAAVERSTGTGEEAGPAAADEVLRRLLRHGGAGAYLRRLDAVALATSAGAAVARASRGVMADASDATDAAVEPRLPPLTHLAALRSAAAVVRAGAPLPAAGALRCRWHGHFLRVDDNESAAAVPPGQLRLAVPDGIAEGVALLERQLTAAPDNHGGMAAPRGAPRPLLLCADAAVVAELNATAAATAGDAAARDVAEEAVILLGHALRPRAAAALVAAAGGRAASLGWPAAAARCAAALPPASEHAPALAAAMLAAFAGTAGTANAAVAAADLAVAWLRASPSRGEAEGAAASALRAQLRAAAPVARAAAAAAAEAHGAAFPPHCAELAAAELARLAASAPPDARAAAALAAAMLRSAAAAWERKHNAIDADDIQMTTTAMTTPAAYVDAVTMPPQVAVMDEAAWRFHEYHFQVEFFAVYLLAYHAAQLARGTPAHAALPPLRAAGAPVRLDRAQILAVMDMFRHRTLWIQAPTTALLLLLLCHRRGRAMLARHLQPLLALQFCVHALLATHDQSLAAHLAVIWPRGIASVLLPARFAAGLAAFTLLCGWCWPLRPRWALPLLSVRAALPALNAAMPRAQALMWPPTGAAGVALQCAACAAAAAHTLRRERRLREAYELYAAAAAAPQRRAKAD